MWFRLQCAKKRVAGCEYYLISFKYIYLAWNADHLVVVVVVVAPFWASDSFGLFGISNNNSFGEHDRIESESNRIESNRIEVEVEAGSFEFSLVMSWLGGVGAKRRRLVVVE